MPRRTEAAVASPGSSRMMAGSEIPSGSSLMSSQLHSWGKNPIFLLFRLFTSSHGSAVPSSVLCSTLPRTALNSVESEPSRHQPGPCVPFLSSASPGARASPMQRKACRLSPSAVPQPDPGVTTWSPPLHSLAPKSLVPGVPCEDPIHFLITNHELANRLPFSEEDTGVLEKQSDLLGHSEGQSCDLNPHDSKSYVCFGGALPHFPLWWEGTPFKSCLLIRLNRAGVNSSARFSEQSFGKY